MIKKQYHVIGVMSGTSLDGIDLAEVFLEISDVGHWNFSFGNSITIPYSSAWKQRLSEAVHFSKGRLETLNREYTRLLGGVILEFIQDNKIEELDAVCSHGHTILHQPDMGVTLQIGNLPEIAEISGQAVVCNFRVQDVAMGGQGAPLVPIGDRLLFSQYDYCLNVGGFANCSYEQLGKRMAYDICPVNIVLNPLAEQLGYPFDKGGLLAKSGKLDAHLFDALESLNFYKQAAPKSLGLEWVQESIFPILEGSKVDVVDKMHTVTHHFAIQIANQFKKGTKVLVTGGGAYNTYLINLIKAQNDIELIVPSADVLEFKEALIFALLGVLKLRGEDNCLASVTGAKKDHSSGFVYQ